MRRAAGRSPAKALALVVAATAAATLVAWILFATRPAPTWPMYQRDPTHNAVVTGQFPAVSWKLKMRGKVNAGLAFDGTYVYTDDFAGDVVAITARTGRIAWRKTVDNIVMSTPAVSSDKVFIGSGSNAVMWDVPDDTLWARPKGDYEYAFARVNGALAWAYHVPGEAMPSAAYANNVVVFATGDGRAYALDATSGKRLWATPLRGVSTMASAMIDHDVVFVMASMGKFFRHRPEQNHVVALNLRDGRTLWSSPFGNADCAPTISQGTVFVEGTSDVYGRLQEVKARNTVVALDEKTGKLRWKYVSAPGFFDNVASSERAIAGMYDKDTYYQAIPATREFIAFAADSGRVRWRIRTSGPVKMSAISHAGRLYFGDVKGKFYVLDTASGKRLKVVSYPHYFTTSPPIIVGKTLMVVNGKTVFAIPLSKL